MGVFKWLRRERVTVTTRHSVSPTSTVPEEQNARDPQINAVRTEEYKRDLAEFQARRSIGNRDLQETPVKEKRSRHSLPVSCTDCSADHDNTFNYEKKSAIKYKKKQDQRNRSTTPEKVYEGVPNIQFLFQNQVFMPGNMFPNPSYSEPHKTHHRTRRHVCRSPDLDFVAQKHIDFHEDDQVDSPPDFYKNSSLPFETKDFLGTSRIFHEEVDGLNKAGDVKSFNNSESESVNKDDSCEDKLWEVMSELKNFDQWADEQLVRSPNTTKSDDSKSDTSAFGLPIASARSLDMTIDKAKTWNNGKWGVVPVQIKKLVGVTAQHVRKKRNTEINILRKCRHPNIILLMGLYPDAQNNIHLICERCVDTLYGIIHEKGRILSAQTAVQYALDISNALVFLRMQGFIHTELNSACVMITDHDTAKLVDVGPCTKAPRTLLKREKEYEVYNPEPQYEAIQDSARVKPNDCESLISENQSELYRLSNCVEKSYKSYETSEFYNWHAPELFTPNDAGVVYVCSRSDVYSLCLILWECCNALRPWKDFSREKLKEQYTLWKSGVNLPNDGTYPGCLLALLQSGLKVQRNERIDLDTLQKTLQNVKRDLDDLGYFIIPARLPHKKATFSTAEWETASPAASECQSPKNVEHRAVVHDRHDSSTESSEKECTRSDASPVYETIKKDYEDPIYSYPEKSFVNDKKMSLQYDRLSEKGLSSACSTPITKIRARIKDIGTPGTLHRSDSTEYCSIFSPNRTVNFELNNNINRDQSVERPLSKLSKSFTPQSYKPLHIKVPEYNFDSIRPILKEPTGSERPSYNFDIKNYSLPTTPIARSTKLRRNAWLSGDLNISDRCFEKSKENLLKSMDKEVRSAPETPATSVCSMSEKPYYSEKSSPEEDKNERTPESVDTIRDCFTGLKRIEHPHDFVSSETDETCRERANSWSFKSSSERGPKYKIEDDLLARVNVKPLVAIHERWIYEANRKNSRSMSLPEDKRCQIPAVKPASHCVDTLQKSLPQLNLKKSGTKIYRSCAASPNSNTKNDVQWEQFCQARDAISKNVSFLQKESDRSLVQRRDSSNTSIEEKYERKIDQATDTNGIEDFIRDMIRKEFKHLLHELSDDASTTSANRHEDILTKGVIESLNGAEDDKTTKREPIKSFSRVKINGNNKPLLQITFSRSGENSLQVLDNCVNVTVCDTGSPRDAPADDVHLNSLKRCQAFNAIQEARSTEDLYIDDDLSTQMQENFGGRVKLIPLHGSLHEILCEKEDDCCLIKVKQENGCDSIYFRCDNSDTESRDAIDGTQDTVVFKRSISLIEERIQRVPKEKRAPTPILQRKAKPDKARPKSEIFIPIKRESRAMSNSSPSLCARDDKDEVEVNIENAMCYQDSSSDECLKCQDNDDFEFLERKIEEDIANNLSSLACGCLEKISEENLSVFNEDLGDKE
ncbi:uncharacterized protein LOC101744858 isoform X3 [Bombyx mori]|nr:uncharacterized protein LOC101744858 isoform X3 [Bombyx mori]XP_021205918.1 uncharacterized protein LOC101744858 isoform X3 [Bombyx mori]XP_037874457.1 uncharacterized protein LOC101744858 isoform X3 [Bombyx mori]XP_037874458.1 uncharacterized protein LOC101744858 isoform X3 [Bombyx mori]